MINIIAIDLDGSLLDDNKNLPGDFWEVAEQVFKTGTHMIIASGRPSII